tara:strand:- start:121901 stop:122596 length:696 start_codon:yes stop_codon:yes gene_type:complete
MLLEKYSYHKTIWIYTGIIGSIFNDIKIKRHNGKVIKVPIQYSGKQKNNEANEVDRSGRDDLGYNMNLPRMAFLLTGWERDDSRMTNRNNKLSSNSFNRETDGSSDFQYNRIPYNFQFEVRAKTKYLEDNLQIVEQILTAIDPEIEVVVKDNNDLNSSSSVIVTLDDSSLENNYEGEFEDPQIIESSFSITLKGWLYRATRNQKVIKQVNVNYFELDPKVELTDEQQVITE